MKFNIPIPEFLWKDKKLNEVKDVKFPAGEYKLFFKVPFAAAVSLIFKGRMIGKEVPAGESKIIILDVTGEDDTLTVNLLSYPVPLLAIIGIVAGVLLVGGTVSLVLYRVERVVTVSTPLVIGAGALAIMSPGLRRKAGL